MPDISAERGIIKIQQSRARKKRHSWLTAGTCFGAGLATGLSLGDWVLVSPKYAKRMSGFYSGDFCVWGSVWLFGVSSPFVRISEDMKAERSIFGVLGMQASDERQSRGFPAKICEAVGPRVLDSAVHVGGKTVLAGRMRLRLATKETKRGDLFLPDGLADRPDVGYVEACSPACTFVHAGDLVLYQRRGLANMYPEGDKEHAYCPESAVFCKVLP